MDSKVIVIVGGVAVGLYMWQRSRTQAEEPLVASQPATATYVPSWADILTAPAPPATSASPTILPVPTPEQPVIITPQPLPGTAAQISPSTEKERLLALIPHARYMTYDDKKYSGSAIESLTVEPAVAFPGDMATATIRFARAPKIRASSLELRLRYRAKGKRGHLATKQYWLKTPPRSSEIRGGAPWDHIAGTPPDVVQFQFKVPADVGWGQHDWRVHDAPPLELQVQGQIRDELDYEAHFYNHLVVMRPYRLWQSDQYANRIEFADIRPLTTLVRNGDVLKVVVTLAGPSGAEHMTNLEARIKGWRAHLRLDAPTWAPGEHQLHDMTIEPPLQTMTFDVPIRAKSVPIAPRLECYVRSPNGVGKAELGFAVVILPKAEEPWVPSPYAMPLALPSSDWMAPGTAPPGLVPPLASDFPQGYLVSEVFPGYTGT